MAQLRTAVRAYAVDGHAPAAVVDRVNNLMLNLGPLAMTTMVYLVIDPATESLELVNAGHPPAARRRSLRRRPHFLWPSGGVPLGATAARDLRGRALPPPDRLDRPDLHRRARRAPRRVDRRSASSGCARSPRARATSRPCARRSVERLVPEEPERRRGVHRRPHAAAGRPPEHARGASTPDSLAPIRYLLRRWLMNRGASEQRGLRHHRRRPGGVRERHRARLRPGRRGVRASTLRWEDGRVTITVTDHGQWRPPRGENRGRGLPLMHALMDEVDVRHTDGRHRR